MERLQLSELQSLHTFSVEINFVMTSLEAKLLFSVWLATCIQMLPPAHPLNRIVFDVDDTTVILANLQEPSVWSSLDETLCAGVRRQISVVFNLHRLPKDVVTSHRQLIDSSLPRSAQRGLIRFGWR